MDDINIVDEPYRMIWIGDGGAYGAFTLGVADINDGCKVEFTVPEMKEMRKELTKLIKEHDE